jgi:hypothetical protein
MTDVVVLDTADAQLDDRPDRIRCARRCAVLPPTICSPRRSSSSMIAAASLVERFTVDGVSWWFRVRMVVAGGSMSA